MVLKKASFVICFLAFFFFLQFSFISAQSAGRIPDEESFGHELSGLAWFNSYDPGKEILELINEMATLNIISGSANNRRAKIIQEYEIKNIGEAVTVNIGLIVVPESSGTPVPHDLQFWVNGIEHEHIVRLQEQVYMDNGELWNRRVNWALINVDFPAGQNISIKIQYTNTFDGIFFHDTGGTGILYKHLGNNLSRHVGWKGTPGFTVIIGNYHIETKSFEREWINNITFFPKRGLAKTQYSPELLYQKTKLNGNTWELQFTDLFLQNYERNIYIETLVWGAELGGFIVMGSGMIQIRNRTGERPRSLEISNLVADEERFFFLTNRQLRVLRHAFFARHGAPFDDPMLRSYFDRPLSMSALLFEENPDFHEGMLTDIDLANIATIDRLLALAEDTVVLLPFSIFIESIQVQQAVESNTPEEVIVAIPNNAPASHTETSLIAQDQPLIPSPSSWNRQWLFMLTIGIIIIAGTIIFFISKRKKNG